MAHWRILRVFSRRLIRIVGLGRGRGRPAVVVTNSRRSICFRFAMDLASLLKERCQVSGAGVRLWHLTPEAWHLSQRVEHAQRH